MKKNKEEIQSLIDNHGDGKTGECPTCGSRLAIDIYGISKVMVRVLQRYANYTIDHDTRDVDSDKLNLHEIHSSAPKQETKLRYHALLAKAKDSRGKHKARHWLVTKRGWEFLAGESIPAKVYAFNNAKLGSSDDTITIHEVLKDYHVPEDIRDRAEITAPQAKVLSSTRRGVRGKDYVARYKGFTIGSLENGKEYKITMAKLELGKPVAIVLDDVVTEYKDVAQFQRDWEILRPA